MKLTATMRPVWCLRNYLNHLNYLNYLVYATCGALSLTLSACTALLPHSTQKVQTPWHSYGEAEALYVKIIPGTTTLEELNGYGIDPARTANVSILSHDDLLRRIVAMTAFKLNTLEPALQDCVKAHQQCYAYELKQEYQQRKRIGNFFMDFLTFRQVTDVRGWQFDAVIVVSEGKVVYKLWSGEPMVHRLEEENRPLGPIQGLGTSLIH